MLIKLTKENLNKVVENSVKTTQSGEVVVLPFDTVYGFACDPNNNSALEKIFTLKNRPLDQTIGLATDSIEALKTVAWIDQKREEFIKKNTPGKYTFIVELRDPKLFSRYCKKGNTAAIRIPESDLVRQIAKNSYGFIAQTSANKTGQKDCLSVKDLFDQFSEGELDQIDLIVDGGLIKNGKPSTIIDLTKDGFDVVRE